MGQRDVVAIAVAGFLSVFHPTDLPSNGKKVPTTRKLGSTRHRSESDAALPKVDLTDRELFGQNVANLESTIPITESLLFSAPENDTIPQKFVRNFIPEPVFRNRRAWNSARRNRDLLRQVANDVRNGSAEAFRSLPADQHRRGACQGMGTPFSL